MAFLVDDLLLSPVRGMMFVLREIARQAEAERAAEERQCLAELSDLHRRLEEGGISEDAFDRQEHALLERLDHLRGTAPEADDDEAAN